MKFSNQIKIQNLKKGQVKRIRFVPFCYLITIVKKDIYFKDSLTSWNIYLTLYSVTHPFELLSSISLYFKVFFIRKDLLGFL